MDCCSQPSRVSVQLIIGLSVYFSLTAVVIIIVIIIVKKLKDKTYDGLKRTERDQHDYVDLQPRAADVDYGVSVISDVAQSRGSGQLHTAQVHVKGQENISRPGIPCSSCEESNKCTQYENINEDAQYETLAQQTRDEAHEYMRLPVRSAASRPQAVIKMKSLPPL